MLSRRPSIVDMNAKLGRAADKRPEFDCDRRIIGAGEGGRRTRRRRRRSEKLNDERERNEESSQRRARSPGTERHPARLPSLFGAPAVHGVLLVLEITIASR